MPQAARRTGREDSLLKAYVRNSKGRQRRAFLRQRAAARIRAENPRPAAVTIDLDALLSSSDSDTTSSSESDDSSTTSSSSDNWSDILGPDWRFLEDSLLADLSLDTETTSHSDEGSDVDMPDLQSLDSDSSVSEFDWHPDTTDMSGIEADDEDSSDDSDYGGPPLLRRFVRAEMEAMHENRYEQPRNTLPRGPAYLPHVLTTLKRGRADHFRQALRVSPPTFDALVTELQNDPIFFNDSNHPQLPVDQQLAVALYRFGHDGNAASIQSVANWAGLGKGTVHLITRRVMTAVLRPGFMQSAVRMPTPEEKDEAKHWVRNHSCRRWRHGWCFVDGTLIPLDQRPTWYGESYFDRKCNYSLNFQIVNLPNLQIIDFGYGHVGSTHDAVAWRDTLVAQKHDELFEDGEWIWADSAYPIDKWVTAPYKKPLADLPDNEKFNNHLSMLRIRSEHAIGFLKGRFHSLKHLRVNIKDEASHRIATFWVSACIGIHAFALRHEQEERGGDADSDNPDPFIAEGLSSSDDESGDDGEAPAQAVPGGRDRLSSGKVLREKLKQRLFAAHDRRRERRLRERT